MGDGTFYAHQEEQVNIACEDCHFSGQPHIMEQMQLDEESAIIASLRFGSITGRKFLATKDKNRPLINTRFAGDSSFLYSKNTGKPYLLSSPAEACTRGEAHNDLSCTSCHTSWAPSCIGCHNEYDPNEPGYDMYANREKTGSWVEYVGEHNAHLPALGYRVDENKKEVIPVIPGMIMTIDVGSFDRRLHDSLIFHRLFAPAAPHTTQTAGRDCKSCHNDPVAIGYGAGKLEFAMNGKTGKWTFKPKYMGNPNDGLPEDAWTAFLQEREGVVSTRSNVRPFTVEEQKNILTAGACLKCHDDNSAVMQEALFDFQQSIRTRSEACVIPEW
jgi:hypothetical protein